MEVERQHWAPPGFKRSRRPGVDFESTDGRTVIEAKLGAQGIRDLHGGLMQLAVTLADEPSIDRGILVLRFPRMTMDRARHAWRSGLHLLRPDLASRLAAVILVANEADPWFDPSDPATARIAHNLADELGALGFKEAPGRALPPTSTKFFDVWKVLLRAWLRRQGPLRMAELAETAGCSAPTAIRALELLEQRGEIKSPLDTARIELRAFPRVTFDQAVGLAGMLRKTRWFLDASGQPPDPVALLMRLRQRKTTNLAVGGVVAARELDPTFDLHGTPRLDLVHWVPDAVLQDVEFVRKVDPGLREAAEPDGAVLAIHRLSRRLPMFEPDDDAGMIRADPVEILLDLHELRLTAQASALVRRLRGEVAS